MCRRASSRVAIRDFRALVVANLKPRKMRFGMSEGMLLATSAEDNAGLQLVHPDGSALGGWTVR